MNGPPKHEPGVVPLNTPSSISIPVTDTASTSLPPPQDDPEELRRALLEQLPPIDPSQVVPFGHLLDRTAKIRYEALRHLVKDRLPETQLVDRPKAIIAYAQESRMALLKLLALLRWKEQADVPKVVRTSKKADGTTVEERQSDVQTAWRLEKLLDYQHEGVKRTREHLAYTVNGQLSTLRMRNADIDTATDVFVTGEYQRLPKSIDHQFIPQAYANTVTASDALKKMNEIIAFRLAVHELIPVDLQHLDTRDGKAYFKYLNLFECAITVGPVDPQKQWCLADVKFLHMAKQSIKGRTAQAIELEQPVKQRILEMVDTALYHLMSQENEVPLQGTDSADVQKVTDDKGNVNSQSESTSAASKRSTALYKLTSILEMLAVANQLEILIAQAMMMRRSEWQQHLQVELSSDRQTLRIRYWQWNAEPTHQSERGKVSFATTGSAYGGEILLSIKSYVPERSDVPFLADDAGEEAGQATYTRRSKIQVDWIPERTWLKTEISDAAVDSAREGVPDIDPLNLDLEAIVIDITKRHAALLTEGLRSVIEETIIRRDFWDAEDVRYEEEETGPCVLLKAFATRWLRLAVNHLTGELYLGEANAAVGSKLEAKLAQASKIATTSPNKLVDNLLMTRSLFVRDSLEERFISMGIITNTRLDVDPQDSEKYGLLLGSGNRQPKPILLAELPNPDSFLLLVIDLKSISYALIQLLSSAITLGLRYKRIANLAWLNVSDFEGGSDLISAPNSHRISTRSTGLDVQPSLLSKLWVYCAARVKVQHVMEQLQTAGIQYRQENVAQTCEVPALYVNTEQMIPQVDSTLFYPVLKISSILEEGRNIQLLLRLKVKGKPLFASKQPSHPDLPADLRYDSQNQVVVLRCDEFSVLQVTRLRAAAATLQLASQPQVLPQDSAHMVASTELHWINYDLPVDRLVDYVKLRKDFAPLLKKLVM